MFLGDTSQYGDPTGNDNNVFSPWDSDTGQAVSHSAEGHLSSFAANNHPVYATHQAPSGIPDSPADRHGVIPAAVVPAPPSPSAGGRPGMGHRLGWSTGLRTSRSFRQRFGDDSIVIDVRNQVHPVEGPVGYSTRGDRLVTRSQYVLNGAGEPTPDQVRESFSSDYAASVVAARGMNPAYV